MKVHPLAAAVSAALVLAGCAPQAPSLGMFTRQDDIGPVPATGSATYSAKTDIYTVTGGGRDIWAKSDDFHFVSKQVSGDLTLAATLSWVTDSGDPHRKAGLMMRQSLAADSPYIDVVVHGNHHIALQYRDTPGGDTHEIEAVLHGPGRMALEREGDYVFMSVAGPDGVLHHAGGGYKIHFDGPYYAGLAVCAHDDKITKTVQFSHVTMDTTPMAAGSHFESTIETIDATSTYRAVVYTGAGRFTAPGWSADGKSITFNDNDSKALSVAIPPEGGPPTTPVPDSGKAETIGGLLFPSPDGKWVAGISPVPSDMVGPTTDQTITVAPASGGQAVVLAHIIGGPGVMSRHPWSPDSKRLVFVSYRPVS